MVVKTKEMEGLIRGGGLNKTLLSQTRIVVQSHLISKLQGNNFSRNFNPFMLCSIIEIIRKLDAKQLIRSNFFPVLKSWAININMTPFVHKTVHKNRTITYQKMS